MPKSPSPLEVNSFKWFAWRVGVDNLMETCSTRWRLYVAESLLDLVGIDALSWMRLTVVLFNSLSRLVYYGCECQYLNERSSYMVIYLLFLARRVNVGNPTAVAPLLIRNEQSG